MYIYIYIYRPEHSGMKLRLASWELEATCPTCTCDGLCPPVSWCSGRITCSATWDSTRLRPAQTMTSLRTQTCWCSLLCTPTHHPEARISLHTLGATPSHPRQGECSLSPEFPLPPWPSGNLLSRCRRFCLQPGSQAAEEADSYRGNSIYYSILQCILYLSITLQCIMIHSDILYHTISYYLIYCISYYDILWYNMI